MKKIPLLDLTALHAGIRDEIIEAMTRVVDSGRFIHGEEVEKLEEEVAAYSGTNFAVGCASGTDALFLALQGVGVEPGDRVITTAFTFFATAGAITRLGAVPVFVDIDPLTFNMNPDLLAEALHKHEPVRAIVPIHLYGGSADMDPIVSLAVKYDCAVIEDGAQAIGAEYKNHRVNGLSDAGCISFYPTKNLGGLGDGGMITTNNEDLARMMAVMRTHGSRDAVYYKRVGVNSRLDALQAAVLRVKMKHLDEWTSRRQANADLYRELLGGYNSPVILPQAMPYQTRHVYNQFVIRYPDRDRLRQYLSDNRIGSEVYYSIPIHLQTCYNELGYWEGDLPETEQAAQEVLALPIHPALPREDIERICQLIKSF